MTYSITPGKQENFKTGENEFQSLVPKRVLKTQHHGNLLKSEREALKELIEEQSNGNIVIKPADKTGEVQGVRGQSGFFNWALTERNIQVRLYLKVVLNS